MGERERLNIRHEVAIMDTNLEYQTETFKYS